MIAELVVGSAGAALIVCALAANQRWLDVHFLPSFFVSRHSYVLLETLVRVLGVVLGLLLALVARRRVARFVARRSSDVLRIAVAVILALAASEVVLTRVHMRPVEWLEPDEEPLRRPDARLGWTIVPARTGRSTVGGRSIEYTFDSRGYRIRGSDEPVDPERPSILFTGESAMLGYGLTWDETIPAQVGAILRIQSANLAVNGFGNDQAYLRLRAELPHFRHPVAVVGLFMTSLFGRNLDDDRPHLGAGLVWLPPRRYSSLRWLAKFVVPYRSSEAVERGIAIARDILGATRDLAAVRGAAALIVVPHFGPEDELERSLRQRILDGAGVPYVVVEIDPAWHVPGDPHPDARATHAIAGAIAASLRADAHVQRSSSISVPKPGPNAAARP